MGTAAPSLASSLPSGSKLTLSAKRRHGRSVNAVADFLNKSLRVPEIYLNFGGPLRSADVVAVDAAGSGDFHAAQIEVVDAHTLSTKDVLGRVDKLKSLPAHFKYIVLPVHPSIVRLAQSQALFSSDGLGRIGILKLIESEEAPPKVELVVKPERFRVAQPDLLRIERVLTRSHPDMFVRV
jgi:hypothetical protein